MIIKAATPERILNIDNNLIVVSAVKGDSSLYRVMINTTFNGYIQKRLDGFYRLNGCGISDDLFSTISIALDDMD
ncbi:hypothetical protein [Pedobacter aquatilis]|uniref:hypothetical protein n=1 Tax=Pedobacter aquatilis TaxID=351343 RepID=UPI002930CFC9|nr:hypothetical protein [Pedobacter aquatilis]